MSKLYASIATIAGDVPSTLSAYAGQIECKSIMGGVDLPVIQSGQTRTEGSSIHGDILLTHRFDKASPGLRAAVSAGTQLGTVTVTRVQTINNVLEDVETWKLEGARCTRVFLETPVNDASGESAEEPREVFGLEYTRLTWEVRHFVNGVSKGNNERSYPETAGQSV